MNKIMLKCGLPPDEFEMVKQVLAAMGEKRFFTVSESVVHLQSAIPDISLLFYDIETFTELPP